MTLSKKNRHSTTNQNGLTDKQELFLARILQALEDKSYDTPDTKELAQELGVPVQSILGMLKLAEKKGLIVAVSEDILYTPKQLEAIRSALRATYAETHFSLSQARDLFKTTRRYMAPLLDYFDAESITIRTEEGRIISAEPIPRTVSSPSPNASQPAIEGAQSA